MKIFATSFITKPMREASKISFVSFFYCLMKHEQNVCVNCSLKTILNENSHNNFHSKNTAFVSLTKWEKLTELALLASFTGVLMKQAKCWHKLFAKNPF